MTGPRKIIDLDTTPTAKLNDAALHLRQGKLWHWERVGCVMCASADSSDYMSQTLREDGDDLNFICLTHGKLEEVEVKVERAFTITIGAVTRTGSKITTDVVLFPVTMDPDERERIIGQMFDAMETEERQGDATTND